MGVRAKLDAVQPNSELGYAQPRHVPLTGKKPLENYQRNNNQWEVLEKNRHPIPLKSR